MPDAPATKPCCQRTLDRMLRVTPGTDAEMTKFRDVFWKVYKG